MSSNPLNHRILQSRFSSLISNLHEAVLVENEERKIVLTNLAFCKMFGIEASPEQMVGQDCANAAEESKGFFKDPDEFVNRINAVLSNKELVIGDKLETVYNTFLERDYIPVFIDGKYMGHMWKYRDVTNTQNLLDQISKKNEDLAQFGYTLSHDIKNPIRGIKSLIDWIQEDYDENNLSIPTMQESINFIKSKVEVASKIIDGVIDYTFSSSDEQKSEEFRFKEVFDDVLSRIKRRVL